jgi:ParB-like chromosome segregation protein Spo0J
MATAPNRALSVQYVPPASLKPHPFNARTHSRQQRRKLAAAIRRFGFNVPVIADAGGVIIAGHARVEAAKVEGLDTVPVIRLEHLTPDELRAFMIADNRLCEIGEWDNSLLAIELHT